MALHFRTLCGYATTSTTLAQFDRNESDPNKPGPFLPSPAEEFGPLASTFRRRALTGLGSAAVVALGANFGGSTSFLLGFWPETSRGLKLDVVYPIQGYSRCVEPSQGFGVQSGKFNRVEHVLPCDQVGDRPLLYFAAGKAESERALDPPPLSEESSARKSRRKNVNEPVVAFGPPGSNGETNVSVIVSPVPLDFTIEAFGGANEVGEAIVETVTGRRPDVRGTLLDSLRTTRARARAVQKHQVYCCEILHEMHQFRRQYQLFCCCYSKKLFHLNLQFQELSWINGRYDFPKIQLSYTLLGS
ncbi:hypothetical protein Syun_028856 [Stephania yunnanensis]|uniref:PsbP C-terminal domain-containing protein n=1 Tax=Stephania yunnanensis TaxID=152371 RepID=A0AAP0E8W0_9MAGN